MQSNGFGPDIRCNSDSPARKPLVALVDGPLNLLDADAGQAFKPDEFDEQPYRHRVFVYAGSIPVSA